jgi:predicted dehydrogenase
MSVSTERRKFLKLSLATAAGFVSTSIPGSGAPEIFSIKHSEHKPSVRFSVIGLNHGHIYSQVETMIRSGGELVSFFAIERELISNFSKQYPNAKRVVDQTQIFEDPTIQLVVCASIPIDRAAIGIKAMLHGKDFMVDKPGIVTLDQLHEVKRVQSETKQIYSILYGERLESKATARAAVLIKEGAIGQVIQTIGLGPHRINKDIRPTWFFNKANYGGILCDIGAHQFDQFLYFTNSTQAEIVASQTGNIHYPQYPKFEDFGDVTIRGNNGTGYLRVDWFTPNGLSTWGDGRLTVLGTEGYIEVRKYIDLAGRSGGDHLFLVDHKGTRYIDCTETILPYGDQFVQDILNRTETAMTQAHCFLAAELAIKAQQQAQMFKLKS